MSEPTSPSVPITPVTQEERKPYSKPAVVHELELETRAGSPAGYDPLFQK